MFRSVTTVRLVTTVVAFALVLNSASSIIALSNNAARVHQIQQERVDAILRACRDTNRRHDTTIQRLDELIKRLPPSRQTRAVQGRAGTVLLINALAPKRDCSLIVRASVPSHK